jgi:diguanylate cyclase (GGDEF)-like protein
MNRIERALRTLSAANRTLLRESDEPQLLEAMCRVIVDTGGYPIAWIGYAEQDADKTIRPAAYAGYEGDPAQAPQFTWAEGERGDTTTGIAIRSGNPCLGRHLLTDPQVPPMWREEARARGFAAVSAYPIRVDGSVIGALTIYSRDTDAFDEAENALLEELADDLGYGIAALRLRQRHREAEAAIERMAFHDPVTGLPNRAMLESQLAEEVVAARAQNRSFALLMVDIDRFREINEVIGYAKGDRLLQDVGQRIGAAAPGQLLAHLGRDEFALLAYRADANQAGEIAQQILKSLEEPFDFSDFRVEVHASIGIALFPGHGTDPELLILRADAAMNRAKRAHIGYAVFRGEAENENLRRLGLVADLRRAIEGNQLLLHYQPKVDMRSSRFCGAEALVRWRHPLLGMVSPDQFIPLAEHTGLIQPLTHWVLNNALAQSYAWRESGVEVPVAVNLSMPNLRDPRLPGRIAGIMTTWGADPGWLEIEVTESSLMEDPAGTLEVMRRLDGMGLKLYVDDFGTGYSSLSYLQKLPIEAIKIDKSFVLGMVTDKDSRIIVRSTIDMAHDLGLKVVAEGVENQEIWEQLAELGCDIAQGVRISEPLAVDRFVPWQAAWRAQSA